MNFITKNATKTIASSARLGELTFLSHVHQRKRKHMDCDTLIDSASTTNGHDGDPVDYRTYETPMCFQYTKNGVIPNLTWEMSEHLLDGDLPVVVSFPDSLMIVEQLKESKLSLASFAMINKRRPVFLTVHDPVQELRTGHNDTKGIAIWTSGGRRQITAEEYLDTQKAVQPHGFQAICDSDTPEVTSKKRLTHSVTRSQQYLEKTLQAQLADKSDLFATIEGGYDPVMRSLSIKGLSTLQNSISGYIIDGFHLNGTSSLSMNMSKVCPLLRLVTKELPSEKPRAMFGMFSPETIVQLVECGVDIFDSSYASHLTKEGKALLIKNETGSNSVQSTSSITLDFNDAKYKNDHNLIDENCTCYTCTKQFTRVYINHLLNTKEMLASVLLSFHNLHVYTEFFKTVRATMRCPESTSMKMSVGE